jgi:hypothetical protein
VRKNLKVKERPLRQLARGPVEVRAERPKALRPNADRPLRNVLKTLSEQRDKPAKGSAKKSENEAKPAA